MNSLCAPRSGFALQRHQNHLKNNISKLNRVLLYHGLGSGKTCTAISLAAAYLQLYKNTNKKIIVVTPASLKENFYKEIMSACGNTQLREFITFDSNNGPLNVSLNVSMKNTVKSICKNRKSDEETKRINQIKYRINKKFDIMSYQGFVKKSKLKQLNLKNTLIIVDEVQNIISNTGETYKVFQKEFEKLDHTKDQSKIILLSGTPMFDKAFEIALVSRLLQTNKEHKEASIPMDPKVFNNIFKINTTTNNNSKKIENKELIQDVLFGKVSYIRGSDRRAYPKKVEHDVNCEMSDFQSVAYKKSIGHMNLNNMNVNNMSRTFLISPRQASNILLPSGRIGKLKNINKTFNVKKHSTKFYHCLENINSKPNEVGPTFIYSNFVTKAGVEDFAEILQKVEGYQLVEKNMCPVNKGKRFAMFRTGQPEENTRILKIFNSYENRNGDIIRIILGSPAMKEGITLLRVRQIHILDPYWNRSRTEQIIGRGVRFCSHKDLPENQRRVDVYHYYAIPKNNSENDNLNKISVDKHIRKISDYKEKSINIVNDLLKQVALDCKEFKDQNELPNIKCIDKKFKQKHNILNVLKTSNKKNSKVDTKTKKNNKKTNNIPNATVGKIVSSNNKANDKKKPKKPWAPKGSGKTGVSKKKSQFKGCPRPRHPTIRNDGTLDCDDNPKFKYIRTTPKGFPCCYSKSNQKKCISYSKSQLVKMLQNRKMDTKGLKSELCKRLNIPV